MLDAPIRKRIEEIAAVRIRYGYRRIHILLLREGWNVNLKRVYRIYWLAGLNLRSKRPKRGEWRVTSWLGLTLQERTTAGRRTSYPTS